jgi:protein-S-isoprenylcysteine O-methyltransferase Ste14
LFFYGVRIQHERGHRVAASGPYQHVRHPGYAGNILADIATPLLLGSAWALIPGIGLAALFVVRTALEDHLLRAELIGYRACAERTPYRLVPGVR